MTPAEVYQKWLKEYRAEKAIKPTAQVEDGDLLDWLAVKASTSAKKIIPCECKLKLDRCTMMCEHMEKKFNYFEDDTL